MSENSSFAEALKNSTGLTPVTNEKGEFATYAGKLYLPEDEILGEMFVGHLLAPDSPNCKNCWAPPSDHEVKNYDPVWRDGDVYCKKCGTRVRGYDAG